MTVSWQDSPLEVTITADAPVMTQTAGLLYIDLFNPEPENVSRYAITISSLRTRQARTSGRRWARAARLIFAFGAPH